MQLQCQMHVLENVSHPNIITVYELLHDEECFFIAQELVNYGHLYDYIVKRGQLGLSNMPESEVRHVAWQLLSSINYLHQRNIAHRDVRLENILIDSLNSSGDKLNIKLTDFGCADFFSMSNGCMQGQVGGNNCMAPEMVMNDTYDCKVDVWSAAVVVYILLSGEMPFYGKDIKQM